VGSSPITHPINFKGLSFKLNPFLCIWTDCPLFVPKNLMSPPTAKTVLP